MKIECETLINTDPEVQTYTFKGAKSWVGNRCLGLQGLIFICLFLIFKNILMYVWLAYLFVFQEIFGDSISSCSPGCPGTHGSCCFQIWSSGIIVCTTMPGAWLKVSFRTFASFHWIWETTSILLVVLVIRKPIRVSAPGTMSSNSYTGPRYCTL